MITLEELEKLLAEGAALKAKFKAATLALDAAIKADEPTGAGQPVVQDHMNAHAEWRAWVMVTIDDLLANALPGLIESARRVEDLREALITADLKIRSFPGADESDVEFIRAALKGT